MKNYLWNYSLIIIALLYSFKAYPQDKVLDSLKRALQTQKNDTENIYTLLRISYHFDKSEEAKVYAYRSLVLAKKLNEIEGQAWAYNQIGLLYYFQHNDSAALRTFLLALKSGQQTKNQWTVYNAMLGIGDTYKQQGNYTEALRIYYDALKVIKQLKGEYNIFDTYRLISEVYKSMHNYPEATKALNAALEYFKKTDGKPGLARAYGFLANSYHDQRNNPERIKAYFMSLKLNQELGDKHAVADALGEIGFSYSYQGNDSAAVRYMFASAKIWDQIGDKFRLAETYAAIGYIYAGQGKYSESLKMDSAALKLAQLPNMPPWALYMSYGAMGRVYKKQGEEYAAKGDKVNAAIKYAEAEKHYLLAVKPVESAGDIANLAEGYGFLGTIYIHLKKYAAAKPYLEKSEKISLQSNQLTFLPEAYRGLATLDSISGNYKQAFEHYKLYTLFRDSVSNEETAKKFLQVQMQHEDELKEEAVKAAQQKKDAEAKRARTIQYLVISSLGILILAVAIIAVIQYRSNKQKQKANLQLHQQKEKVETTLSELKSAQAQLIQSEKMASLGELTAGIAHEIQNPLNFVNNFSEVNKELVDELQSELKSGNTNAAIAISNDIKENEEKINHHGKRADAIVKGMLQHSQASTGQKEATDINALADEYIRLSYHGIRAKDKTFNVSIQTDFDRSIGKINIIPQDIGRVLLNLYNNAFYAVKEKKKQSGNDYEPTVSVSTKNINNKAQIRVRDNGTGIPQKVLDKIFQPFFTTKPTGEGTGLGLSLSYDIIKAHGGEIKIETEEGVFTEFIIHLP